MSYVNPPLNYMGGKYKLLPQIVPLLDTTKTHFCDVFTGGGSVGLNVDYPHIHLNDILSIGIHEELYVNGPIFVSMMQSHLVDKTDKEGYLALRTAYNVQPTPAKLWALILSCNSNMMRFNKKKEFNQTFGRRTFNKSTEAKTKSYIDRTNHLVAKGVQVKFYSEDFKNLKHWFDKEDTMIYLDPPYYNTEAGYNVFWNKQDEITLLEYCVTSTASIAVSGVIFDKKETSPLLIGLIQAGWDMHNLDMSYKKIRKDTDNTYQEVLITNYKIKEVI